MKYNITKEARSVLNRLKKAGFEVYLVGGCVRDLIIKRETKDWDFTTNATPEQIMELFPDGFYDNKFGTVGIENKEGGRPYEITTFRTEQGYSDSRHPDKV